MPAKPKFKYHAGIRNVPIFTKYQALYWYCNYYHKGQYSWQYRVLSTVAYEPSVSENPETLRRVDYEFKEYYDHLVRLFERTGTAIDWDTPSNGGPEIYEINP